MTTPETPPPAGGDDPGRGLSGVQRAGIVLGGLAVLLIAFVVIRSSADSGESSSSSAPQTTSTQTASTQTAIAQSTQTTTTGETETEGEDGRGRGRSGSGSTEESPTQPAQPAVRTIRVVNGQPQGGVQTISFKKGDQVALKVQSDTADEIHVHGYDLKKDVAKGGSVQFNFNATIEGRFEIELENAGTQIANLEVTPS